jgi:hypothetical protein
VHGLMRRGLETERYATAPVPDPTSSGGAIALLLTSSDRVTIRSVRHSHISTLTG